MENLLKDLCSISGISGNEQNICNFVKEKLAPFADVKIENDNSVIATFGPENAKKHILFDAHIDQIGLIVTEIDENGFIKFDACGGIDPRILIGSIVTIHGIDTFKGVICSTPPHLSTNKENGLCINDMFIDLGISKEKILKNVAPGDYISISNKFYKLLNENISSPATDDRSGVCVLIKLAEKLSKENLNTKFTVLLSSREEVGQMGAKISAYKSTPDEAISVDVSFAKQPDVTSDKHGVLSDGPMIGIAASLSKKISENLVEICKKQNIPYQIEVMGGKSCTNADVISVTKSGIPCGLVSIPQRYMHTGIEIVNIRDLENVTELLFNYAKQGGTN